MGTRSPTVAAVLSAVLPGLGQLYHRDWTKGVAFLLATAVIDSALSVTARMIQMMHAAIHGAPVVDDLASLVIRSLPILMLTVWSVLDARRPR